jgi:uncharacterized protein with PQ loop repeat
VAGSSIGRGHRSRSRPCWRRSSATWSPCWSRAAPCRPDRGLAPGARHPKVYEAGPTVVIVTEMAGFVGVALSGAAYVPQIVHLIRSRCSAGVSRPAYTVWLVASILLAIKAVGIQAWAFIALGAIQVMATTLILLYAARYKGQYCPSHITSHPAPLTSPTNNHSRDGSPCPEPNERLYSL